MAPPGHSGMSSKAGGPRLPWRAGFCRRPQISFQECRGPRVTATVSVLHSDPAADEARRQGLSRGARSGPTTLRGSPPDALSSASPDPFLLRGHFQAGAWPCAPPTCLGPALAGQGGAGEPVCPRPCPAGQTPLLAGEEPGSARITVPSAPQPHGPSPALPRTQDPASGWEFGPVSAKGRLRHRPLSSFPTPELRRGGLRVE